MYQLTIDSAHTGTVVTGHPDRSEACRALQRYVVAADVYLQAIQSTQPHSSYDLVDLTERPRITGQAVIEQMPVAAQALYYHAGEARRWIDEHRTERAGYPSRVLARARAAAANAAAARILLQEAASLADVEQAPDVDLILLHALAHRGRAVAPPLSAAHLADIVAAADTTPPTDAILIWWLALLIWAGQPS